MSLHPNAYVLIHGLQTSPKFNGLVGTLSCFSDDRWVVSVKGTQIRVRANNLRFAEVRTFRFGDIMDTVIKSGSKGRGLHAKDDILAGTTLKESADTIIASTYVRFSEHVLIGASSAWGLVKYILGKPADTFPWVYDLHTNHKLTNQSLVDAPDRDILARLSSTFGEARVKELFGKVVTNFVCNDETHQAFLSYRTSMINHSCEPNAISMVYEGLPVVTIITDLEAGAEILLNYDSADQYIRDW